MPDLLTSFLTPWWPDLASFLRMGRHGLYVWPTLAICLLALAGEWWLLKRRERQLARRGAENLR